MRKNNNNYHKISKPQIQQLQGLADLLHHFQLTKSKSQVRREVQKGGLYLNNRKVELPELSKSLSEVLQGNLQHGQYLMVRWGKKKYQFLQIKPS